MQVRTLSRPGNTHGRGPRQSGQTSHQFCRHLRYGVNAGRTTSLERAKWELITLSGGNTVLKVFPLLSPPLLENVCLMLRRSYLFGLEEESVLNQACCPQVKSKQRPSSRRMPVELHACKHEVPGSNPGGSNKRGHSSMVEHDVSSETLSSRCFLFPGSV